MKSVLQSTKCPDNASVVLQDGMVSLLLFARFSLGTVGSEMEGYF